MPDDDLPVGTTPEQRAAWDMGYAWLLNAITMALRDPDEQARLAVGGTGFAHDVADYIAHRFGQDNS